MTAYPPRIQALFEWLVDGAPGAVSPAATLQRFADDLAAEDTNVERVTAWVRTLHPTVLGRSFSWERGGQVVVKEHPWNDLAPVPSKSSPLTEVFRSSAELRVRVGGVEPLPFPDLEGLRKAGFVDWVGEPLRFSTGDVHGLTFATRSPAGFQERHLEWFRHLVRPLARVAEIFALRRNAANLLSAYVGRNAGERVLGGQVRLGEIESIRCVVWFSDLRSFTSMSSALEPAQVIAMLNEVFACQVVPIEAQGGEVLKFIGDGLLAIFPINERSTAAQACAAAAAAAQAAQARLVHLNSIRAGQALHFGVALHLGEVAYGNIGGANRLDFTCIGATVNQASRIESLTGKLGKMVLVSSAFAAASTLSTRALGAFELKGIPEPQTIYELA